MKKIATLTLLISLLISLTFPPLTAKAEELKFYTVVSEQGAVMTASADPNGMKIMTLKQGVRVELVRQEASWSKIEYSGRLGWVRNEAIKPFTQDLLPIYSNYYQLLEQTDDVIYALVTDLTQDGIEDLYMVVDSNPTKGQYIEMIYSDGNLIYKKNLKHGLTILKDATDYYLFHHAQTNTEKKYKLADLNDQAKTDYYEESEGKGSYEITANTYLKSYFIVQSGNGNVTEQTLTLEQVASKDYYGGSETNDYDESIYLENYSLSSDGVTKTLLKKEFDALFAKYEKAKGLKVIYSDEYKSAVLSDTFSFDLKRAKTEVLDLAAHVASPKEMEVASAEVDALKLKLAQSVFLEMPYEKAISRNAATIVTNVENGILKGLPGYEAAFFTKAVVDFPMTDTEYLDRAPIDAVIYDFYGARINTEEFNNLALVDGRILDSTTYQFPIVQPEPIETYIYRQLQSIEQLEEGYDAVRYVDYEMPIDVVVSESNENTLIAGQKIGEGYVLFKRLPFKSDVKWVYVDTVEQIRDLDVTQYVMYENSLDLVQKYVGENQVLDVTKEEEEPIVAQAATPVKAENNVEQQQTPMSWGMLSLGLLLLFAATGGVYYGYRKRSVPDDDGVF